jgi:hypothetical protein
VCVDTSGAALAEGGAVAGAVGAAIPVLAEGGGAALAVGAAALGGVTGCPPASLDPPPMPILASSAFASAGHA